ncbi:MAG: hypothetical protein U7126_26735 [Microcoleus sp.]
MIGGWPETGFLREYFVTGEEIGKNPVSLILRECPETGFLREYFVTGEEMGKNPVSKDCARVPRNLVSPIVRQGLKPLSHSKSPRSRTKEFFIFISDFQSVETDFRY